MTEPSEEVKRVEQRYEKALDDMEKHYKNVFEQIRDEIEQSRYGLVNDGLDLALDIIDKHIKESEE